MVGGSGLFEVLGMGFPARVMVRDMVHEVDLEDAIREKVVVNLCAVSMVSPEHNP